jgi:phosphotransacetylase
MSSPPTKRRRQEPSVASRVQLRCKNARVVRSDASKERRRKASRAYYRQQKAALSALQVDHDRDEETFKRLRREVEQVQANLELVESRTLVEHSQSLASLYAEKEDVPPDVADAGTPESVAGLWLSVRTRLRRPFATTIHQYRHSAEFS